VLEDCLDNGADLQAGADVDALQGCERGVVGRRSHEVTPELADEEGGVQRVFHAEAHRVFIVPVAGFAEHGLFAGVMMFGREVEVLQAAAFRPFGAQPVSTRPISLTSSCV